MALTFPRELMKRCAPSECQNAVGVRSLWALGITDSPGVTRGASYTFAVEIWKRLRNVLSGRRPSLHTARDD
jgi:hypothetical protein